MVKPKALLIEFSLLVCISAMVSAHPLPVVDITDADITQDKIHVELSPEGLTGILKLELVGFELTGGEKIHLIREAQRSSGSYNESFDIPNLSTGDYVKIKATWTVDNESSIDEYNYHIKVLGKYKHTCYNTPYEPLCPSDEIEDPQWYIYVIGNGCGTIYNCEWHVAQGKYRWLDCIANLDYGTGSGKAQDGHIYIIEYYCTEVNPPSWQFIYRFRRTDALCPADGEEGLNPGDVAIMKGHPHLKLGDKVFVYQHGVHIVRDYGRNLVEKQLDHYYGISGCFDCPSLGNGIMTVKLYE